jgi:hypothetical protein
MPEEPSGQVAELLPAVYAELRRLAHYHLKSERAEHTLQSTALVHDAFLRLVGGEPIHLRNRAHFVAVASKLMRQILVDYARELERDLPPHGCAMPPSGAVHLQPSP